MRVVLTGSEHTGGLAALRSLRAAGIDSWAAVTSLASHGARSRSATGVSVVPGPRSRPADFARQLVRLVERIGADVVLPGTEAALLALANHRDAFPASVAVGAPSPQLVEGAIDKERLPELAARARLASPPTALARAGERPAISYPAVVKPRRSELASGRRLRRFEVRVVHGPEDLDAALRALPEQRALVQPHLAGPIVGVNGVAWEGDVVASIHQIGYRTWPPGCGIVSFAETVPRDPGLERSVRALVAELGWTGVFNIQLIRSGGTDHLIDINPRLYHSLALATAAGLNLPAIWAHLLLGRRPSVNGYRSGMRFRSEDDARAVGYLIRAGRRQEALRALAPRPRTVHAISNLRDPGPILAFGLRALKRLGTHRIGL